MAGSATSSTRAVIAILFVAVMLPGCSGSPGRAPESKPFTGMVAKRDGTPFGNVLIHFHPLKPGFSCATEVAADGTFSSTAPPGDYAWSLRRSEMAKASAADAGLKAVPVALQETDLKRKVRIDAGGTVNIVVE